MSTRYKYTSQPFICNELDEEISYAISFKNACKQATWLYANGYLQSYIRFVKNFSDTEHLAIAYDTAIRFYEHIEYTDNVKKYTRKLKQLTQKQFDDFDTLKSQIEEIYFKNPLDKSIYESLSNRCQAAAMLHRRKTAWHCLVEYCFFALRYGGNRKADLQKYTNTIISYIKNDYYDSLYKFDVSEAVLNYCILCTAFFEENAETKQLKKDILSNICSKRKTPVLEKIVDCITNMIEQHQLPDFDSMLDILFEVDNANEQYLLLCAACILYPGEYNIIQQLATEIDFFNIPLTYEKHLPLFVKTVVLISQKNVKNNFLFKLDDVEGNCSKVNEDYASILKNFEKSEFPTMTDNVNNDYAYVPITSGVSLSPKKYKTALLLAIFGGLLGLHDLYLGYFFRFLVKTGLIICIGCLFFSDITVFLSFAFFVFLVILALWYIIDISFLIGQKKYDSKNRIVRR